MSQLYIILDENLSDEQKSDIVKDIGEKIAQGYTSGHHPYRNLSQNVSDD